MPTGFWSSIHVKLLTTPLVSHHITQPCYCQCLLFEIPFSTMTPRINSSIISLRLYSPSKLKMTPHTWPTFIYQSVFNILFLYRFACLNLLFNYKVLDLAYSSDLRKNLAEWLYSEAVYFYLELSHLSSIIFSNSLTPLMINVVGEWTQPNNFFKLGGKQDTFLHLNWEVRGILFTGTELIDT